MDRALEQLECPPLGAVAPPDGKAKARNEAPVSTSPTTGMPSMESWPEMGSATAHPTGATLALGHPSVSLNAMGGALELPSAGGALILGRKAAVWLVLGPVASTSAATVCGQDSGRQNAPLHHRGSIAQAACPVA